jgi:hypothetical protein
MPEAAQKELSELASKLSTDDCKLNIVLQEDLTIRGGAQLWLMNCGSRLQAAGHSITFLLPSESLIIEDCEKIEGVKVVKVRGAPCISLTQNAGGMGGAGQRCCRKLELVPAPR